MVLDNLSSHSSLIFIAQLKWKPSESCQNPVMKLSQTNKKLCLSNNGMMRNTGEK